MSTTWDWEQMARFGFLTGTLLVCAYTGLIMPVVVKTMTRRVGGYGLHHWLQVGISFSSCLWMVMLLVFNTIQCTHAARLPRLFLFAHKPRLATPFKDCIKILLRSLLINYLVVPVEVMNGWDIIALDYVVVSWDQMCCGLERFRVRLGGDCMV